LIPRCTSRKEIRNSPAKAIMTFLVMDESFNVELLIIVNISVFLLKLSVHFLKTLSFA
jgi:hypothetical protein